MVSTDTGAKHWGPGQESTGRWPVITDAATTSNIHAIVLADASGQIRYWSPGAERLFGWEAAEAVGQRLDLIVPEEYRERHWAGFNQAMSTGHARLAGAATNLPVRCRDGTVLAFPGRLMLLTDAHHAAVGAIAIYEPRTGDEEPWEPIGSAPS